MKIWFKALLVMALLIGTAVSPAFAASSTGKLTVKLSTDSNKKVFNLGDTIELEAASTKKSDQFTAGFTVNGDADVIEATHEISGKKVISTGSFTPDKVGTYKIHYEISAVDAKGKTWLGKVDKEIKVEGAKISLSASPLTATMKQGDQLYLLVKYPVTQIDTDQKTELSSNYPELLDELPLADEERDGFYQKLFVFTPKKSGSYKLTFTVNNETSQGETTVSISVKK
ncbi:hypothetical protein [Brevibacillus fulvus]|uniref:Uncharacterized protein n=1 Tax=Brevibacillus fulvus TaxID=1125967 RepID=A0A938XVW7_9BACL|nr:hypothetical protein [Brevibacillus fulvus]MBM7591443.1 hypothetical protein [Brevibacillus fulvus]